MKPVPFAQYLARQQKLEAAPAPAAAWPPRPKTGARPSESQRQSPLLRQPEKEKPDRAAEFAGRLEQGRLRAFQDGRDAAQKDFEEERERLGDKVNAELAKARAQWAKEEAGRLAEAHRAAFVSFEQRCALAVANILRPFLVRQTITRVTDALVETLEAVFASRGQALFEISGPPDLLDALKDKFGAVNARMEFKPDSSIDVRVRVEDTLIETQLGAWLEALHAYTRDSAHE
jgi:hypothetical protein